MVKQVSANSTKELVDKIALYGSTVTSETCGDFEMSKTTMYKVLAWTLVAINTFSLAIYKIYIMHSKVTFGLLIFFQVKPIHQRSLCGFYSPLHSTRDSNDTIVSYDAILQTFGAGMTVWELIIGSAYISRICSINNEPRPDPVPPPIE